MEILEKNNAHERTSYTYVCVHCKSTLRARPADGTTYDNQHGRGVKIICPVCSCPRRLDTQNFVLEEAK